MQLDLLAEPAFSCGKTSPVPSRATAAETLLSWLARWQDANSLSPKMDGERKAWRWVSTASSSGPCLTRSGSEWRSGAVACSLSSTLETGPVDRRYYLSPTACAGILRRAEKRGKTLPAALETALRSMGHDGSHANGGEQVAVAFNWQNGGGYGNANEGLGITTEGTGPLQRSQTPAVATAMQVRRLTPRECERLQGFPDDYLLQVPWRSRTPPPDGPMYKALGNSMAVPVMRWIGERIAAAVSA